MVVYKVETTHEARNGKGRMNFKIFEPQQHTDDRQLTQLLLSVTSHSSVVPQNFYSRGMETNYNPHTIPTSRWKNEKNDHAGIKPAYVDFHHAAKVALYKGSRTQENNMRQNNLCQ
jgi:hypothetical protein